VHEENIGDVCAQHRRLAMLGGRRCWGARLRSRARRAAARTRSRRARLGPGVAEVRRTPEAGRADRCRRCCGRPALVAAAWPAPARLRLAPSALQAMVDMSGWQATLSGGPDHERPNALRALASAVKFDSRNLSPLLVTTLAATCLASATPSSGGSGPSSSAISDATFIEGIALLRVLLKAAVDQHAWRDSSLGLLCVPPQLFSALLECVGAPCQGLLLQPQLANGSDASVRPVCETLKAVVELLPDPKKRPHAPLPQEAIKMAPSLETLCRTLLAACTAEHHRPTDNFPLMNATWRLLARAAATLALLQPPLVLGRSPASSLPVAIFRCLLQPLAAAFGGLAAAGTAVDARGTAANDTLTPSDTVAAFYCDKLRAFLSAYAQCVTWEASQRSPFADELAHALARAYGQLLPLPPKEQPHLRQSRRKLRSILDACVLVLLSAPDVSEGCAQHGLLTSQVTACSLPVLVHWAELGWSTAKSLEPRPQPPVPPPAPAPSGIAPPATASPAHAYGFSQLVLAGLRASLCSCGSVAPASDRSEQHRADLQRRVIALALPAWLGLLPCCCERLCSPWPRADIVGAPAARPTRLATPMLNEACALVSRASLATRAPLLMGLVDGCCAPHPVTRRVAVVLFTYAIRPLPVAESVDWLSCCLLAANRLDEHVPGSDSLRSGLLAPVAATCASDAIPAEGAAVLLVQVEAPLAGDGAFEEGSQTTDGCRLATAVELLEALAAQHVRLGTGEADAGDVCCGPRGQGTDAICSLLHRCGVARWLCALIRGLQRAETSAQAVLRLRGISALLLGCPAVDHLPIPSADGLPAVVARAFSLASGSSCAERDLLCAHALKVADAAIHRLALPEVMAILQSAVAVLYPLAGHANLGAAAAARGGSGVIGGPRVEEGHEKLCLSALCALLSSALRLGLPARDPQFSAVFATLTCAMLTRGFDDSVVVDSAEEIQPGGGVTRAALRYQMVGVAASFMMGGAADSTQVARVQKSVSQPSIMPLLTAHLTRLNEGISEGSTNASSFEEEHSVAAMDKAAAAARASLEIAASSASKAFMHVKRARLEPPFRSDLADHGIEQLRAGLQALHNAAAKAGGGSRALGSYRVQLQEHAQEFDALLAANAQPGG
jgi:hypothetical protein